MNFNNITNIEFDGIDHSDYPDYCDAYIKSFNYNGIEATESQLEEINNESTFVHEKLFEQLF